MLSLEQVCKNFEFKISGGSEFGWPCYGPNVRYLDFESDHAQLVLDSIDKIIIENNREELVEQTTSDKILCMIEVYGWENRFNPILLEWLYINRERVKQWT